jgi:small-conductance mechanosensitive channel
MIANFGTSALEFELWFWIRDPATGIANVKSDVLLALWDALDKQGARLAKPTPSRVIYEMAEQQNGSSRKPASKSKRPARPAFPT